MAAFLLLLLAAGWVYLATLPGVGDAESRVDAIVMEHGGRVMPGPPPVRLADAVVSTEDENFYDGVVQNVASGAGRAALALPRRLTWGEASLLAGLPQAPSAYDPIYHLPLARLRRRHVLDQLVVNGYLTPPEAAAFQEPLPLGPR